MRSLAPLLGVLSLLLAKPARACAVCATSDPTIDTPGTDQPFAGRLRASGDLRVGDVRVGEPGVDEIKLQDRRLELRVSYAPSSNLQLALGVPMLERHVVTIGRGANDRASLGDIELRGTYVSWRGRVGGVLRRSGTFVGVKLPTAPLQNDALGRWLPSELQPGCGSIVPLGGAYYSVSKGMWSLYATGSLLLPFAGRNGPHPGPSVRAATTVQIQPTTGFASRIGMSSRLDVSGELNAGAPDPNSGGLVGYVTTEIVMSPTSDLVVTIGAFFPAIQVLRGHHREGPIAAATVGYDF